MAKKSTEELISAIKEMTVLELSEFVKAIEEEFGVSAAPVATIAPAGGAAAEAPVEEKTDFKVVLKGAGEQKVQVIKAVRDLTNLGLKEAKELVEGAPATVVEGLSKADAEAAKAKLEEKGATVAIE